MVRTVQPVLEELGRNMKKRRKRLVQRAGRVSANGAAGTFSGAGGGRGAVVYPCLGEFGAVIFIAGNIAWKTE